MKQYKNASSAFVISLIIASMLLTLARAENRGRPDLIFAHSTTVLSEVDTRDATVAMKILVAQFAKDIGYTADSYITESLEKITEDLEKGNVDAVGVTAVEYLKLANRSNIELIMTHVRRGQPAQKYILLTKIGSGVNRLGDLKQKKVAFLKNDQISMLFLNTLLLRQNLPESPLFFSGMQEKLKPSQVILSVFFGQADACVTTESSLKTVIEMNPQVQKGLNILASSPPLVDSIMAVRKNYNEDAKRKFAEVCQSLKNTPRGRQILLLFKIDDLIPATESSLDTIKSLVAEYERLKTRQAKHVTRGG